MTVATRQLSFANPDFIGIDKCYEAVSAAIFSSPLVLDIADIGHGPGGVQSGGEWGHQWCYRAKFYLAAEKTVEGAFNGVCLVDATISVKFPYGFEEGQRKLDRQPEIWVERNGARKTFENVHEALASLVKGF